MLTATFSDLGDEVAETGQTVYIPRDHANAEAGFGCHDNLDLFEAVPTDHVLGGQIRCQLHVVIREHTLNSLGLGGVDFSAGHVPLPSC